MLYYLFLHNLKLGRDKDHTVSAAPLTASDAHPGPVRRAWHIDAHLKRQIAAAMKVEIAPRFKAAAELIAPDFDAEFYLTSYQGALRSGLNPLQHYLQIGAHKNYDPSPHFSTSLYKARQNKALDPGVNAFVDWIQSGRDAGEIGDPFHKFPVISRRIGMEPPEGERQLAARRGALLDRLKYGKLGEMVAKASELDPLVAATWPEVQRPKMPPFHTPRTGDKLESLCTLRTAAGHRPAQFVIAVNRPRWGSGLKEEGYLAKFLVEAYGPDSVLVIYTDVNDDPVPGRFPPGVREVNLKAAVKNSAEDVAIDVLLTFLRSLRPIAFFNINSLLSWRCQMSYPAVMSQEMKIYNYLFCNEKNYFGAWVGYPVQYVYRCFDWCEELIVDSHYLKNELVERFALPAAMQDRVRVIEAPADSTVALAPEPPRTPIRGSQVFWSGRFDRQKRLDLLPLIAMRMPDVTFRVWGRSVLDNFDASGLELPNIVLEGTYESFDDLPLNECDAWLYTSEWDGVPHLLLEVCMTGVPIVGSVVGGTGEVLKDHLSWPVTEVNDVEAYVSALRDILANPDRARTRAVKLRDQIAQERNNAGLRSFVAGFAVAADVTTQEVFRSVRRIAAEVSPSPRMSPHRIETHG